LANGVDDGGNEGEMPRSADLREIKWRCSRFAFPEHPGVIVKVRTHWGSMLVSTLLKRFLVLFAIEVLGIVVWNFLHTVH
jgi:hypothetical protein